MALYVASHYRNTPNDLQATLPTHALHLTPSHRPTCVSQLMSDAPAHQLFVLLGPIDPSAEGLPDVLCVIQACRHHTHPSHNSVSTLVLCGAGLP